MIDAQGRLLVFELFSSDRGLPKFAQKKKKQFKGVVDSNGFNVMDEDSFIDEMKEPFGSNIMMVRGGDFMATMSVRSWFGRLIQWAVSWFARRRETMTVEQFFSSVHNSAVELEIVDDRAHGYQQALSRAHSAGQTALFEQLFAGLNAYRMESQLLAIGMARYLEEADLVKFYKQSKKGMRLDWIKNFARQIPPDVLVKKMRADDIGIFDNYAVLHYDPNEKSWAETEAEKARRKDPILFGLMEGRRLYYVGDWMDEYCDLTLDQIADAIGKDAVKDVATEILQEVHDT